MTSCPPSGVTRRDREVVPLDPVLAQSRGRDVDAGQDLSMDRMAEAIGLIMEGSLRSTLLSPELRIGLTVGFLGGFTTFSTFSMETLNLIENSELIKAASNVLLSVVLCLFATWVGVLVGRQL